MIFREGSEPGGTALIGTVVQVVWRAAYTHLEVTVRIDADDWDVYNLKPYGWQEARTRVAKSKRDPRIDDDDDED